MISFSFSRNAIYSSFPRKIRTKAEKAEKANREMEKAIREKEKAIEEREKAKKRARHEAAVPGYWKYQNSAGYHSVLSLYVKGELEQFMHESSCCSGCSGSGTSMAKVVSVNRIENLGLWQKYQTQ